MRTEEEGVSSTPSAHATNDLELKEREVIVRESELELKRREASSSAWRSPLVLSVLGVTLAAAGNAAVSYINAGQQRELEDRKSEQSRILEMIKTDNADKAAENLKFLVDSGLVSDAALIARLNYFQQHRAPGTGPSLPSNSIADRVAHTDIKTIGLIALYGSRFRVVNHVLYGADNKPVTVMEALHKGPGRLVAIKAVILHFTGNEDENAAVKLISGEPDSNVTTSSVHLIIRRDGTVTQLVAFDVPANHVGQSAWNGLDGLNKYSIGIMFENRGNLQRIGDEWPIAKDQIFFVGQGKNLQAWERYTPAQNETARDIMKALGLAYPSIDGVLRHSEVTVPLGRKNDPGPALEVGPLVVALEEGKRLAASKGSAGN